MPEPIRRGSVVWARFGRAVGREQQGVRPAVVVASDRYLSNVPELLIVVAASTRDRGWAHHVQLSGPDLALDKQTFALTEQPTTISRARVTGRAGAVDRATLARIDQWLRDFFDY